MGDNRVVRGFRNYIAIPAALVASLYACGGDNDNITGDVTGNGGNGKTVERFSDGVQGQFILAEAKDGKQTLELILNDAVAENGEASLPPIETSVIDEGNEFDYTKDGRVNKNDLPLFLATKPSSQQARTFTKGFGYWEADNLDGRLDSGMNAKGEVYLRLNPDYLKLNGVTNIAAEIKNPAASKRQLNFNPADVSAVADGPTLRFVDDSLMGEETDVEYTARNDGRWRVRGNADGSVGNIYLMSKPQSDNETKTFNLEKVSQDFFVYIVMENKPDASVGLRVNNIGRYVDDKAGDKYYEDEKIKVYRINSKDAVKSGSNELQVQKRVGEIYIYLVSDNPNLKLF